MGRLRDFFYGTEVKVTECKNGYTISKNGLGGSMEGCGGVCYVPLPGDKLAVMISRYGMALGQNEGKLDICWQDYIICMDIVVDTEDQAREICKAKANELARQRATKGQRIVYKSL